MRSEALALLMAVLLTGSALAAPARPSSKSPRPTSSKQLEARARAAAATPSAPRAAPLTLDEVLASSRFHAPQVLEALARVRGAEGKLLSAEGAFDTVFSADANSRVTGYYGGTDAGFRTTQPLAGNGGSVYGGYRISRGAFPPYEADRYTADLGEVTAGAVLSLLRDRLIDERRFNRALAEGDVVLADTDRLLVAIGVQGRALAAYNNWVIAGQRLRVYRDLLQLALDRQAGFRRQVDEGLRPRILLTENEQNILRRQTLVVQSEQALAVAATTLSLYLRDRDGQPIVPGPERLPDRLSVPLPLPSDPQAALRRRPDLKAIDVRVDQARQRLQLDRNAFLPRLDVKAEVNQYLGGQGAGGSPYTGTDTKVGLTFSVPLQQRVARGRLQQTQSEIDAFRQRRRFLEDQITADVQALSITADNSRRLLGISIDEQDRALTMAEAERRRFSAGASDFFLVNVREEAAADAQVRRLDAAFRQIVAHADLAAATADLEALGL